MPFKSKAQERYFNANRAKLEGQGVNVDEWNQASKGASLPDHVSKYKRAGPGRPRNKPRLKADRTIDE